jgi:GDPmannose 4,6-dehydratase
MGENTKLSLGNLNIERDWGWAPEYVEAISLILDQPSPEDYIVATGQSHTLTEFVETAFNLIDRNWKDYVTIDEDLMRPADIVRNKVDCSKASTCLGWKARSGMNEVISKMLDAEMRDFREACVI